MSKIPSKGTKIQSEIATVLTDVAQVLSIDGPGGDVETFEADDLNSCLAGVPMKPTGRAKGGTLNFDVFFDPALAGHQALLALITTPASTSWAEVFPDATTWTFDGVLKSVTPKAELSDGLKASVSVELDGLVTYP